MTKEAGAPAGKGRIIAAEVLVVLASLTAIVALFGGFVRFQVFDAATFKRTSADLIAKDTIRQQVATTLVDQLYGNVDVEAALRQDLPAGQQAFAGPLSAALRELANRAATRLLARPRVQAAWVEAVSRAQSRLLRLLDDRSTVIKTEGGLVVLDLQPLVVQLGDQIAIVNNIAGRLPPGSAQITIMKASQLQTAQRITHILKVVGGFFWLVPLLLFACAIWLGRGRRRRILRQSAIGALIAGFLVLVIRKLAGSYVTTHLVASESLRPAVRDAWDIVTQLLADGAWTLIFTAGVALVGVWLAGETKSGRAARRKIAEPLARPELAFGAVVGFVVLLVWWGPTPQAHRWYLVLAATVILAVGVEALRRQSAREVAATGESSALPPRS
jgi:hypothetical protein